MKLSIPWKLKGIRPAAREPAWESARRGRHVGERIAQHSDPRLRSEQLFAVHERINELTRQLARLQHAPAQGPVAHAPPSYNNDLDQQLVEAIACLERRMDGLVGASREIPAAPLDAANAPADAWTEIDQALAETTAHQRAFDADADAPVFAPQPATAQSAAPLELEAPAQTAPIPAQNLSGLEQHLRDITSQIEALRQPPQIRKVVAEASRLDDSRPVGGDTDTLACMERGLAEAFATLRTAFAKQNATFSFNQLAGQTAIFIVACPVPGEAHCRQ